MSIHESLRQRGDNAITDQDTSKLDAAQARKAVNRSVNGPSFRQRELQEHFARQTAAEIDRKHKVEQGEGLVKLFLKTGKFEDTTYSARRFTEVIQGMIPDARLRARTVVYDYVEGSFITFHDKLALISRIRTQIFSQPTENGSVRDNLQALNLPDLALVVERYCADNSIPSVIELLIQLDLPGVIKNAQANVLAMRSAALIAAGQQIPRQRVVTTRSTPPATTEVPPTVLYELDDVLKVGGTTEIKIAIFGTPDDVDAQRRLLNTMLSSDPGGSQAESLLRELRRCHPAALQHIVQTVLAEETLTPDLRVFKVTALERLGHLLF
ncbi:MAG: hypothetical protein ABIE03_06650 [Patescibacteria group bacterium]|nr:hypothetical protein [Patescibacteria group bacterium]